MKEITYNNINVNNTGGFMDNDKNKIHKEEIKIKTSFIVNNPTEDEITNLKNGIKNLLSYVYQIQI